MTRENGTTCNNMCLNTKQIIHITDNDQPAQESECSKSRLKKNGLNCP